MKRITIESEKGMWEVSHTEFATVFVRPNVARNNRDERTTTVYKEMYDILKCGDLLPIKPLSRNAPKDMEVWEVRYYKDCPPVRGEVTKTQMPEYNRVFIGRMDAIGFVLDEIGYPTDNAKLKEFFE